MSSFKTLVLGVLMAGLALGFSGAAQAADGKVRIGIVYPSTIDDMS